MYDINGYNRHLLKSGGTTLQVVLKVSERCNIACTYCYFFFGGDDSYMKHPPVIPQAVVGDLANFLRSSIAEYGIESVRIIIHGGEPLLMKKAQMIEMLASVRTSCINTRLEFTIQTNAMLIDDEWIEIFEKNNVYVGVSLDGPPDLNDLNRIDKKGNGTYAKTAEGIRKLFSAFNEGRIVRPGLLCVINPTFPARRVYNHFINELGFENVDFLLPDDTHDSIDTDHLKLFEPYLLEMFEIYRSENNKNVSIRLFNKFISSFGVEPFFNSVLHRFYTQKDVVITVASNGDINPDDILRTTDQGLMDSGINLKTSSFKDIIYNENFIKLNDAEFTLPNACQTCDWRNVCRGGDLYHRYSKLNGFNNPSIYCDALKSLLLEIATTYLLADMPLEKMQKRLDADPVVVSPC